MTDGLDSLQILGLTVAFLFYQFALKSHRTKLVGIGVVVSLVLVWQSYPRWGAGEVEQAGLALTACRVAQAVVHPGGYGQSCADSARQR